MNKTRFTYKELLAKSFKLVTDANEVYLQFVFDEADYVNSTYIASNSVDAVDWLADYDNSVEFTVSSPKKEIMTEQEIDKFIQTGIYE